MRTELLSLSEAGGPERQRTDRFVGTFFMEHLRSYRWVVIQSLVAELRDFARGLEHGRRDGASGTDGLRALQVAAAIRRSSTSGLKEPVQ
jgi:predicted dehydrogenase